MKILIDNRIFEAELTDEPAGKAFAAILPLEVEMADLNNNEKYYYTSARIPRKEYHPGRIECGDLLLWQSDCIVLFYMSFDSPFPYTRIGRIKNPEGLMEILAGKGSVKVRFE